MSEDGKTAGITSQHPKSETGAWQRTRGGGADNRVCSKTSGRKLQLYESDREGRRPLGAQHFWEGLGDYRDEGKNRELGVSALRKQI